MQLLRLPAERGSIPRARPCARRPGGGLHRARGSGDPAAGGEEHQLEPGVFARVGPNEIAEADHRRSAGLDPRARRCARKASSRSRSSPRRASPTRSPRTAEPMADVTVKRIEDFEAIFGGGFRRARAGLGVTSFGLAVIDLPPHFTIYPDHDQAHDRQEEVYTLLSGQATVRVGGQAEGARPRARRVDPRRGGREAQDHHRGRARSGARDRRRRPGGSTGRPSSPRRAPRRRRWTSSSTTKRALGAGQRNRSSSAGRWRAAAAPARPRPTTAPGAADQHRRAAGSLSRARSAAAGELVGDRDRRRRELAGRARPCARASRRAATRPAQPIATSPGRPATAGRSCRRSRRRGAPAGRARARRGCGAPRRRRRRAAGRRSRRRARWSSRSRRSRRSSPPCVSTISAAALARTTRRDSARTSSTRRGSLPSLGGRARRATLAGLDRRQLAVPAPRPSRRPSARRRSRRRRRARAGGDRGGGDQLADADRLRRPRADRLERTDLELARSSGWPVAMGSRASAAAVDGARSGSFGEQAASAARSSGVSRSSASEAAARWRPSWPARSAPVEVAVAAARRRTPARSRRRGRGGARWCRCRGGPGTTATRPAAIRPRAASSSAGSSSGQSPGSSAVHGRRAPARG